MYKNKNWRLGVGIMLVNDKLEIFAGERIDNIGAWQMPQGGLNKNEPPLNAAKRELFEETGIESTKVISENKEWLNYTIPTTLKKKLWKGKYVGQKQKWFAMKFIGEDWEINLKTTKKPEFINWKWMQKEELLETIVPFKQELYIRVFKTFESLLQ